MTVPKLMEMIRNWASGNTSVDLAKIEDAIEDYGQDRYEDGLEHGSRMNQ